MQQGGGDMSTLFKIYEDLICIGPPPQLLPQYLFLLVGPTYIQNRSSAPTSELYYLLQYVLTYVLYVSTYITISNISVMTYNT